MKAVKIERNGGPEVIKIEEITLDKPGNDEVLIEHVAIGLNYTDNFIDQAFILLNYQQESAWKPQELLKK